MEAEAEESESDEDAVLEEFDQLLEAGQLKESQGDARGALRLYEQCLACAQRITDAERDAGRCWSGRRLWCMGCDMLGRRTRTALGGSSQSLSPSGVCWCCTARDHRN